MTTRTIHVAALAIVTIATAAGCRALPSVASDPGVRLEDAALEQKLRQAMTDAYPPVLRATHRTILTAGGRQYVLDGYVLARQPRDVRLMASADVGGTIFDVVRRGGALIIMKNAAGLRLPWLEGAGRDAAALYLRQPSERAVLVRHKDGSAAVVDEPGNGFRDEFRLDTGSGRLSEFRRSGGGRLLYRISFSGERTFPDWPKPTPARMLIDDYELNYSVSVLVTDLRPAELSGEVFEQRE